MKSSIFTILLTAGCHLLIIAQPIPSDSLYLGQTLPGSVPQIFNLPVSPGSFAAERIAISPDNREIFYAGIHNYYPTAGDTVKYYRYMDNHWTGPLNLFAGYLAPGLSVSGDTLYIQDNSQLTESYFSIRNGYSWSNPQRFLTGLTLAHYFQQTNFGHSFISTIPNVSVGLSDWCSLDLNPLDSIAVSLGLPLNSGSDNLDFFVARDESFMILARSGLRISYHKEDGNWTNPKSLGSGINFGLGAWGPYVSADNKYLFYTTGTLPDYSDTYIYWARIDELKDSLRYTNFVPYLKNGIPQQDAFLGKLFAFTLPDSTFIDDDGNNTLTYDARLLNGNPLPSWLSFDSISASFTGIPEEVQLLTIKIRATDDAGAYVNAILKIKVQDFTGFDQLKEKKVEVFPNPTRGDLHFSVSAGSVQSANIEIDDLVGKAVLKEIVTDGAILDLSGFPKGIYIMRATFNGELIFRKIRIE